MESSLLNKWMGHRILFKAECLQTIGAFKLRGAMNFLSHLDERGELPKKVVANSSGNHAQGVRKIYHAIFCHIYIVSVHYGRAINSIS